MNHLLSIVHLTDLHLSVDARGNYTDLDRRGGLVRILCGAQGLARLPEGLVAHRHGALTSLFRQLPGFVAAERRRAPVVVAQTGDVEALGGWPGGATVDEQFPGFAEMRRLRDAVRRRQADVSWVDLFGNHDIWTHVAVPSRQGVRAITEVEGLAGPWPDRCHAIACGDDHVVEILRLNTVSSRWHVGSLAHGKVGTHPTDAGIDRALRELAELVPEPGDRRVVRVLLSHHPVHRFPAGLGTRLTTGVLWGRRPLARLAGDLPIHLIVNGHLHQLDPPVDSAPNARLGQQRPLTGATAQLTAESPTVDQRGSPTSFAIYRIYADDNYVAVGRLVSEYTDSAAAFEDPHLTPFEESLLFEKIPLG